MLLRRRHAGRDGSAEGELSSSGAKLPTPPDPAVVLEHAHDAIIVTDLDGTIVSWNATAEREFGSRGLGAEGVDIGVFVPPTIRPYVGRLLESVGKGQGLAPVRREVVTSAATTRVVDISAFAVPGPDGDITNAAFVIRPVATDVGAPRVSPSGHEETDGEVPASRRALRQSEARYRAILEAAAQGIALVDSDGRFSFANRQLLDFFGLKTADVVGSPAAELLGARVDAASKEAAGSRFEMLHVRPSGIEVWGLVSVTPLPDDETGHGAALVMVSDVTELKTAQQLQERQAIIEPVTGLASPTLFADRVRRALQLLGPTQQVAVLVADVDGFRDINDAFGHVEGNRALREVGARLKRVCPEASTVTRVVGDQFAILLEDVGDHDDVAALAAELHAAVATPLWVAGVEVIPTLSIGVAFTGSVAPDTEVTHTMDDLRRRAHASMRDARAGGRGRTAMDGKGSADAVLDRLALIPELRRAISEGQLELRYQPAVDVDLGFPMSVEALVRWRHPDRGMLDPGAFIPVAEDADLIRPLGRWVMRQACRDAVAWHESGIFVPVAINVSGHQLAHDSIVSDTQAAIAETGIDPRLLVLEITESVFVRDREASVARLRALRRLGVQIALDDFGTGYSSLARLSHLPLDVLKVDRSFVQDIAISDRAAALVRGVVEVARAFSLDVIAEGVETEAQRRALLRAGCSTAQGYHWSRPLPLEQLTRWFDKHRDLPDL